MYTTKAFCIICRFGKNGSGRQLKHLNLTGCTSISDSTLKRLATAIASPLEKERQKCDNSERTSRKSCPSDKCNSCCHGVISIDELSIDKNGRPKSQCHKHTVGCHDTYEVHVNHSSQDTRQRLSSTRDNVTSDDIINESNKMVHNTADDTAYRTKCDWSNVTGPTMVQRTCSSNAMNQDISDEKDNAIESSQLEFLSLAGCFKITDNGLR